MLANSPPLPLIIDHILKDQDRDITTEDEEGILLALQHHHRVRRIRLEMPVPNLQKLVTAMDEEFPMLEFLCITAPTEQDASLVFLRHFKHQIYDTFIPSSANFRPYDLLQRLALMPQLETLGIGFHSPVSSRDIERQLSRMPIVHVTLPNLRGSGSEAQLTFSVPHLLEFIRPAENLRFSSARLIFHEGGISTRVYPYEGAKMYALFVNVGCKQIDWQVASAAQILNTLKSVFSSVEHLTLEYAFVDAGLAGDLSRSLQLDDGEPLPVELLPELKEVSYSAIDDADATFTPFIVARQKAGRPVTLVRRDTTSSESFR
ncbi:hypothetical protein BGY98DRAFT_1098587 [Russula aff. rugulosa BPL654]|nr:hypothetical protein BGY98DRAFT_1098587 [Russula aff. rugulosa BPL654]